MRRRLSDGHSDVVTLMNVLVDFCRTGQIGPLRCGMPLADAEELLGPGRPHPAIRMKGPDIDGYPYSWGGLNLVVTRRSVSGLWIRLWPGSTTKLPSLILPASESHPAAILREELLAALNAVDCPHQANPRLTFGEQSSVLAGPAADVCAVFSLPGRDNDVDRRDRHYLDVIHKHAS